MGEGLARNTSALQGDDAPPIFVTGRLPDIAMTRLEPAFRVEVWEQDAALPAPKLREACARSEGLLCLLTDRIDAALLRASPGLRVISTMSVGVDHIDVAAASERGIPVGHTPGVLTETTADLCFGLLLAAARRIVEADRFVRAGQWVPERVWAPDMMLGRDLHAATLGLIGLGAIGQAVARRAQGFGMRVIATNRSPRTLPGVTLCDLDTLLREADFVSVHIARCEETLGLIAGPEFAKMKPGATLINTARGGIVDEEALAAALRGGALAAAGLDVFAQEPLAPDSPLLDLPNVVLAPHIGSASRATREKMAMLAVDNLLDGLRGARMRHCANPGIYEG